MNLKYKYMNNIGIEYGKWLSTMEWNYLATVRPHYSLTPNGSDRMMSKLIKYKYIDNIFFALERDIDCRMNHAHLLLKTSNKLNRKELSKALGLNSKAVGYFDSVLSSEAVSYYCSKHISKPFSHHNFF